MATLGVRLIPLQALSANRQTLLQKVFEQLSIQHVSAPHYLDGQARVWLVYDDPRFTLLDAAIIGTVVGHITDVPDDASLTRQQVINFVQSHVVLPQDITIAPGADPFNAVLAANGAPLAVQMRCAMPAGLTPVPVV